MATTKSAPLKKTPVVATTAVAVKKTSGNVVSIQEALRAQAAAMSDRIAPPSGIRITTGGKNFSLPDGTKVPGPLELVVVDFVARNEFYENDYDKDSIVPPACFAIGSNPVKLVPSANSPLKQADDCTSCPMNAFGSKGKGKACSNTRLLAVLPPDADDSTPLWLLKVSPTGGKAFDGFVRSVATTFQLPPIGVVVTVSFDENEDYPKLVFSDPKPNNNVGTHYGRQEEARALLVAEPDITSFVVDKPAKAAPKRAAARR